MQASAGLVEVGQYRRQPPHRGGTLEPGACTLFQPTNREKAISLAKRRGDGDRGGMERIFNAVRWVLMLPVAVVAGGVVASAFVGSAVQHGDFFAMLLDVASPGIASGVFILAFCAMAPRHRNYAGRVAVVIVLLLCVGLLVASIWTLNAWYAANAVFAFVGGVFGVVACETLLERN